MTAPTRAITTESLIASQGPKSDIVEPPPFEFVTVRLAVYAKT
jgi:hypothetical protein